MPATGPPAGNRHRQPRGEARPHLSQSAASSLAEAAQRGSALLPPTLYIDSATHSSRSQEDSAFPQKVSAHAASVLQPSHIVLSSRKLSEAASTLVPFVALV